MNSIVVMGVAGCGKSSLANLVANACQLPLIEGDDFHSTSNREKMRNGIPLTDVDRTGWLSILCDQLRQHPKGVVLTCSALKRSYRDRLRQAAPEVGFVFLEISPEQAQIRVAARTNTHFFSSSLVESQFATLESPVGEPGVLHLHALTPLVALQSEVTAWLHAKETV